MIILVRRKWVRAVLFSAVVIVLIVLLYKPYLKKYEYPLKFEEYVSSAAEKYSLDPYLIYSVIKAESKFQPEAKSPKDAQGLMQITPETGIWAMGKMNIEGDIFDPETNINVGSWYLSKLLNDFDGDLTAALAAYNAGGSNVKDWKETDELLDAEDIEFEETYGYVTKTLEYLENYHKLYEEDEK